MAKLKLIRTEDQDLSRIQQNISTAFDQAASEALTSNVVSVSADYRVQPNDLVVFVNAARGPVRITLPLPGKLPVTVRKTDASSNAVTVVVSGGQAIHDQTPMVAGYARTFGYDRNTEAWYQFL